VHELGIDPQGRLYMTMELVRGRSLAQLLGAAEKARRAGKRLRRFDLRERLEIMKKVCDAVAYAHAKGVIHRDLKPANVMVGEFGEVLVMDWGLAKVMVRREAPGLPAVVSDRAEEGALMEEQQGAMAQQMAVPEEIILMDREAALGAAAVQAG